MSLNYKKRKKERGFAIALALLMLVAMSLMGATLMVIAAGDHKRNGNLNVKQQTFYAAETGITEAKKWLSTQTNLSIGSDPDNQLSFCKTAFFPELSNPKAVKDYIEKKNLSELISGENKLSDYSYEYLLPLHRMLMVILKLQSYKPFRVPQAVIFLKEQLIKIQVLLRQHIIIFIHVVVTQINHHVMQIVM